MSELCILCEGGGGEKAGGRDRGRSDEKGRGMRTCRRVLLRFHWGLSQGIMASRIASPTVTLVRH